jgi:hypothetical protein
LTTYFGPHRGVCQNRAKTWVKNTDFPHPLSERPGLNLYGHALAHIFDSALPTVKAFWEDEAGIVFSAGATMKQQQVHQHTARGHTVGLHIRGGDLGAVDGQDTRSGIHIDHYIAWVDTHVKQGMPVGMVYVASDIRGVSVEFLTSRFPNRQYVFCMLDRTVLPVGIEVSEYAEIMSVRETEEAHPSYTSVFKLSYWSQLRYRLWHGHPRPYLENGPDWIPLRTTRKRVAVERHNRTHLFLEAWSDMNILSSCDMLLGSPSNWMVILTALHRTKNPSAFSNQTCIIQTNGVEQCLSDIDMPWFGV